MSGRRLLSRTLSVAGILLLVSSSLAVAGGPLDGIARRMTDEAIQAGIDGEEDLRATMLAKVHQLAPDYAPAHWEAGQIKVDGTWVPVSEAQSIAKSDPRLQDYETRRAQTGNEAGAQLALAQWCDEQGLRDEADYHLRRVLRADPQNAVALERLGLVWFAGQLQPRSELENLRTRQREEAESLKEWNSRINTWMRKMAGGEIQRQQIIDEMREQLDESAIPAFEQMAGRPRGWNTSQGKRRISVSTAFLEVMADRETFEGTQTLVRHTLLAQSEAIRDAAQSHLSSRPQEETIPLLLSSLAAPLESRFDIRLTPSGRAVYSHEVFAEGAEQDQLVEVVREGVVGQDVPNPDRPSPGDVIRNRIADTRTRASYVDNFRRSAQAIEQQVASENASRKQINERAIEALQSLTGKDFGENPSDWWTYWQETNGYETNTYRPVEVNRDSYSHYVYLPPPERDTPSMIVSPPRPRCECFVAGTPVWTKTGQKAIETVEAGDQVLCQDLATGELLFRPVLDTTLRQPSPMIHISAGDEIITATEGHPFWVPGKGWRMARQLSPGDRLLTVSGLVEIEGVTAAPNNEAFNLVVADHANYFVGSKGMLVHDNTPRRPEESVQATR